MGAHLMEYCNTTETWSIDLIHMSAYKVRNGLLPYGAMLVLHKDFYISHINVCDFYVSHFNFKLWININIYKIFVVIFIYACDNAYKCHTIKIQ